MKNNNNILDKVDELFENFETVDFQKLEVLIKQVIGFLEQLKFKLLSDDEQEKKEAIELAQQLQKKLNALAEKAFSKTSMTKEQIAEFLATTTNFAPQEWNRLQDMEKNIGTFQDELFQDHPKPPEKEKRSGKKDWLKS